MVSNTLRNTESKCYSILGNSSGRVRKLLAVLNATLRFSLFSWVQSWLKSLHWICRDLLKAKNGRTWSVIKIHPRFANKGLPSFKLTCYFSGSISTAFVNPGITAHLLFVFGFSQKQFVMIALSYTKAGQDSQTLFHLFKVSSSKNTGLLQFSEKKKKKIW